MENLGFELLDEEAMTELLDDVDSANTKKHIK